MDIWPGSSTHAVPESNKGRPRKEDKSKAPSDGSETYPVVDHGSLTAANLHRVGRRLEWSFLSNDRPGPRLAARSSPVKIFPVSRPQWPSEPQLSIMYQAEQGANFLRTHYPDVDIASDLIREELTDSARLSSRLQDFDPYLGNLITPAVGGGRAGRHVAFLAFPMGPTGCDLNISPLTYTKKDFTTLKPSATPVRTFETPIQQILARESQSRSDCLIAIRNAGSTKLLEVQPKANSLHGIVTTDLASFTRSDFGDRPLTDMAFHDFPDSTFLGVNDHGTVFKYDIGESTETIQTTYTQVDQTSNDHFWRLSCLPEPHTPLLLSAKQLSLLDFRVAGSSPILANASLPGTVFTSVETNSHDNMIRLVSTDEVTWIDQRSPLRPVFGVKHARAWDRTLRVHSLMFGSSSLTFLTSAKNALVTVYDVAEGGDNLCHLNTLPYALPSIPLDGDKQVGHVIFRHANDTHEATAIFLQLSDRGSIHRLDLALGEAGRPVGRTHDWTQEVLELEKAAETSMADVGAFAGKAHTEVDLEPVYRRIFGVDESKETIEDPAAFYDTVDSMSSFWQNLDAPVEQVLTTFDVAFRSGNEPANPSRADFLTGSSVNSVRGYRALLQDRIPREQVAQDAPWHHDWTPSFKFLVPDISDSVQETHDCLKRYDLLMDDYRPGPSIRSETEAREQLTVDLALASEVYAPHAIKLEEPGQLLDDEFETMSRATEAMSIGIPEPPAVQFSFLHPVPQDHYDKTKDVKSKRMECPLGVRLLLSEWEIGTNPETYQYRDPYDNTEPSTTAPPRGGRKTDKAPGVEVKLQQPRMPPVIAVAATAHPPVVATQPVRPRPAAQSQGADDVHMGSQPTQQPAAPLQPSQEMLYPSTQVLPGPFGGRPAPVKKKPAKKRMGGF